MVLLFDRTKELINERFSNHPTGEERSPYVISFLGIGKMTLTELAHNDLEVKAHFEKKKNL